MSRRRSPAAGIVLAQLVTAALTACGDDTVEGPPPSAPERIRLTSPAFAPSAAIPSGADPGRSALSFASRVVRSVPRCGALVNGGIEERAGLPRRSRGAD
jgi:hypothetical protein